MMKSGYAATGLFLILVLIIGSTPNTVRADDGSGDESHPIRLYATAFARPIGAVASFGPVIINGQRVTGQPMLWGGELMQAPAGKQVSLSFDSIGRVTLNNGAAVRFAALHEGARRTLIATVIDGEMAVELLPEAGAYVRACGSTFTATTGSNFHMNVSEGKVVINRSSGAVSEEQQPAQRTYVVRPVGVGANISVRARATRQIQVQVTDENDRPVPDLPIIFALGGQGLGSLGSGATVGSALTVTTNSQGIASIAFTAADATGSTSITATVEGTRFSWTGNISIAKATGFWTTRNSLIVAAAAAAAGVGIGIAATQNDEREPIVAIPPPVIRP